MKYFTTLSLTLTILATTATAIPVEKLFNLVTANAANTSHNGLYVSTQTDGPLNSNAVLGTAATASTFYLDNNTLHYEAPNGAPWEMALVSSQSLKGPVEVSVSPTTGSEGFGFDGDGSLVVSGQSWGGWIVCDGTGEPSLDYVNTAVGTTVPAGCDRVSLTSVVKSSSRT